MTRIIVDIQRCGDEPHYPNDEEIESWVQHALHEQTAGAELTEVSIRLVDSAESAELNRSYRNKQGPTNVLSFPFEIPPGYPENSDCRLLGDIVICAPLVAQEAEQQKKNEKSHWAHLVIHGVLHLLGYDHQTDSEAREMEEREIRLLSHFKIPNPYQVPITNSNEIR